MDKAPTFFWEVLSTHSRHRKYLKAYFSHRRLTKGLIWCLKIKLTTEENSKPPPPPPLPSHLTRHHYLVFNGKSNVCASSDSKTECPICVYINFQSTRFAFHMRQPDMDTATRDSAKSSNKFPLLHEILFKILKVSYKTKSYCINLWLENTSWILHFRQNSNSWFFI